MAVILPVIVLQDDDAKSKNDGLGRYHLVIICCRHHLPPFFLVFHFYHSSTFISLSFEGQAKGKESGLPPTLPALTAFATTPFISLTFSNIHYYSLRIGIGFNVECIDIPLPSFQLLIKDHVLICYYLLLLCTFLAKQKKKTILF